MEIESCLPQSRSSCWVMFKVDRKYIVSGPKKAMKRYLRILSILREGFRRQLTLSAHASLGEWMEDRLCKLLERLVQIPNLDWVDAYSHNCVDNANIPNLLMNSQIELDRDEYLTSVSGCAGSYRDPVIKRRMVHSARKEKCLSHSRWASAK